MSLSTLSVSARRAMVLATVLVVSFGVLATSAIAVRLHLSNSTRTTSRRRYTREEQLNRPRLHACVTRPARGSICWKGIRQGDGPRSTLGRIRGQLQKLRRKLDLVRTVNLLGRISAVSATAYAPPV